MTSKYACYDLQELAEKKFVAELATFETLSGTVDAAALFDCLEELYYCNTNYPACSELINTAMKFAAKNPYTMQEMMALSNMADFCEENGKFTRMLLNARLAECVR